ncbi:hypothetical protein EXM22_06380 [Oceanispirochaeta crateris]|uniref:DUF2232 domain-containing protein n=1 Tax=Oceanispirochaeta crateris TaxID=2518645 RepID=A0A5C1QN83_9SPIO|nr:hypothetical protein [Oceanispirochaeta crateris]QEN07632.1 hypothetical protein EXM22_06380 [Oceanispirochaeta crateris]
METGKIGKITGISLITALLYNVGILSPFFAIPLQFSAAGRNRKIFLISSVISIFLILSFRTTVLIPLEALGFVYVDGYILFLAVAGLYVCNFELKGFTLPVRIAFITAGAAALSLLLWPLAQGLREQMIMSLNQILLVSNELNISGVMGDAALDGETLFLILQDLAGSTGLVWYFFFIAFSYWMGMKVVSKSSGAVTERKSENWDLPEVWVWFLFIPLTLFLVNKLMMVRNIHILGILPYYAVTNIILISAGAYAIRGIGIIQSYLNRRSLPRHTQRLMLMTSGFLIVIPGVNLVLLILTAGLGVSELWINYRLFDKE